MTEPTPVRINMIGDDLPHDDNLKLAPLFDSSGMVAQLNEHKSSTTGRVVSCTARHVRYQPGRSCTVLYQVGYVTPELETEEEVFVYAKALTLKEFKRRGAGMLRGQIQKGIILDSPTAIPGCQAMLNEFPHDDRLPQLQLLSVTDELKQLIIRQLSERFLLDGFTVSGCSNAQPLRYKPENRFIARCKLVLESSGKSEDTIRDIILRIERKSSPNKSFALTRHLRSMFHSNPKIGIPEPLAVCEEYGISTFEAITAGKLSDMLTDEHASEAVRLAAEAAAALHSFPDTGLAIQNSLFHLQRVRQSAEIVGRCVPSCGQTVSDLVDELTALASTNGKGHVGLVHGDFHQGQLLYGDGKTWILDLDRAYTGDCTADIGSFLGQMKLLELRGRSPHGVSLAQQFVHDYEKSVGRKVAPDQISFWMVVNLLGLASRECRRLKPGWTDSVKKILNSCLEITDKRLFA